MIVSKHEFILHSISFRLINLGLLIILLLHFLAPGFLDAAALFGYFVLIIGVAYVSSIWKEFRSPLFFFIPGMILSALVLQPLYREGIGLFVYLEYAYNQLNQPGIYWGIIISLLDLIGMFRLAILIKKRVYGDGIARTYTRADELLYAKDKGRIIEDSKYILGSLIVLIPAFIGKIVVKMVTSYFTSMSANGSNPASFAFSNLMLLSNLFLVLLLPSILLICWCFFDVSTIIKELMKGADGKNKTI